MKIQKQTILLSLALALLVHRVMGVILPGVGWFELQWNRDGLDGFGIHWQTNGNPSWKPIGVTTNTFFFITNNDARVKINTIGVSGYKRINPLPGGAGEQIVWSEIQPMVWPFSGTNTAGSVVLIPRFTTPTGEFISISRDLKTFNDWVKTGIDGTNVVLEFRLNSNSPAQFMKFKQVFPPLPK